MASSPEFVAYVCDQLAPLGQVHTRKMFGEYGVYFGGKYFGLICDDRFMIKITEAGRALVPHCPLGVPYEGAKEALLIEDLEDRDLLVELVKATCAELPDPKPKKKKVQP
ncbi:TfoX/Sxy family protein [Raoultibacter phocaeensis]|uniref:TfoX/Sxy family protein n=1 Tax=Raoultibacter phocaeensis TaxID=2479841 RepID=UPI00111A8EA5|nr:TfoX/Sxy family protein [Raoultibacter phocaeensis]